MSTGANAMRETLNTELKAAMKNGDRRRVDTIRLVNAALKDRDIEARGQGKVVSEQDVLAVLQKMVKSRQESLEIYTKAGRDDLARVESEEVAVIQGFLPQQMDEGDVVAAIDGAIAATGACSIKDMGKVVAALKADHAGRMDFAKASGLVKARLSGPAA